MLCAEAEEACEGRGCAFRLRLHSGNPCGVLVRGGVLFSTCYANETLRVLCEPALCAYGEPEEQSKTQFQF
jgi:hypothetical protein